MGVKDQGLQEYLKDNERFADFMNGTLFAGKQIIKASYLKEVQRKMIIPGLSEPPVRTLRATIPENESHIFR